MSQTFWGSRYIAQGMEWELPLVAWFPYMPLGTAKRKLACMRAVFRYNSKAPLKGLWGICIGAI